MNIHNLPIGKNAPKQLNAFIEIPKGGHNKYEFDEDLQVMKLDRVLHSPLFYPVEYGFIPETRAEDGDHADVLVITDSPTFPGCVVEVRPIGVLLMSDDKGKDDKILAVPAHNPHYSHITKLKDIPQHALNEIVHFFEEYKTLEKKEVSVKGFKDKDTAYKIITDSQKRYAKEIR